ncbi:hypothetical protein [Rhodospirillum centenum]|uniref:hypothetical protein n=1 Tax=Rhodospirillum centenum TaxID=34018 RepID=UPI00059F6B2A|nr:hypothetical protein [Rhodospirillum centenum]
MEPLFTQSITQEGDRRIDAIQGNRIMAGQKHGQKRRADAENVDQGRPQPETVDLRHQGSGAGAIDENGSFPPLKNQGNHLGNRMPVSNGGSRVRRVSDRQPGGQNGLLSRGFRSGAEIRKIGRPLMKRQGKASDLAQKRIQRWPVWLGAGGHQILLHAVKTGEPGLQNITGTQRQGLMLAFQQTQKRSSTFEMKSRQTPPEQIKLFVGIAPLAGVQPLRMGSDDRDEELNLLEKGAQSFEAVQGQKVRFRQVGVETDFAGQSTFQIGKHAMEAFQIIEQPTVEGAGRNLTPLLPRRPAPCGQPGRLHVEPGASPS